MNSFLAYLGGKSSLSRKIIPLIPEHHAYVEVFAGAAWLLFRKPPEISSSEIINDINKDLITLYRVVKNHFEEFIRTFKWLLISRDEYERLKSLPAESLTDIQRAARFYYLIRLNYGARVDSFNFSVSYQRRPHINLLRIEEGLSEAHIRLSNVFVENMPYQNIIERYDRPETFFYLDPPYYDCEKFYGKGIFSKEDFLKLNEMLSVVKGKFIMSINDVDAIRQLFKGFRFEEVGVTYSISSNKERKPSKELLIMNY
jgi:DNA adenine methylase